MQEENIGKKVYVGVTVGYEVRTVTLTRPEWSAVKAGKPLIKKIEEGDGEGGESVYEFSFNGNEEPDSNLYVSYWSVDEDWDGGVGFIGKIEHAYIDEES